MTTEEYKDCFVAVLDILGITSVTKTISHEELTRIYESGIPEIKKLCELKGLLFEGVTPDDHLALSDMDNSNVNTHLSSDSIVLWTTNSSYVAFCRVLIAARFFLNASLHIGLPLRGAITIGPISFNKEAGGVWGKAYVEAHELEQIQQWSGCMIQSKIIDHIGCLYERAKKVLHSTNCDILGSDFNEDKQIFYDYVKRKMHPIRHLIDLKAIVEYAVPCKMKNGDAYSDNCYVIDWPNGTEATISNRETVLENLFQEHKKSIGTPDSQEKLKNTIDFVKVMDGR